MTYLYLVNGGSICYNKNWSVRWGVPPLTIVLPCNRVFLFEFKLPQVLVKCHLGSWQVSIAAQGGELSRYTNLYHMTTSNI